MRYGKAGSVDIRTKNKWARYKDDYRMSIAARNYVKLVVFVEARCQAKGVELSDVPRGHPSELDVYNTYSVYSYLHRYTMYGCDI